MQEEGRFRSARTVDSLVGGRCRIGSDVLVNLGSNDYLGLAHELSSKAQIDPDYPFGATASALIAGRTTLHAQLEESLASFEETESALLFPTGYAANLGLLTGLVEEGDAIWCDRENHASIVDACRLASAKMHVYRHDRLELLERSLDRRRAEFRNAVLVTDGVFSMDGTVAPLAEICEIAEKFDVAVVVDEAHGTGVLGRRGRGACELRGVEHRVLARVGTMSKAMGGIGGFVAASSSIVELLRNSARSQFFSTALPPYVCGAMRVSLKTIQTQPDRRLQLCNLVRRLHTRLDEAGLSTIPGGLAPIIPILVQGDATVARLSGRLKQHGFFVPAIRHPTVRKGTERLRLSFSVAHRPEDLDRAVRMISDLTGGAS